MTRSKIHDCLRDLQVIATTPRISEEEIAELMKRKLIKRTEKTSGSIWLTQLGMYTKTGQI